MKRVRKPRVAEGSGAVVVVTEVVGEAGSEAAVAVVVQGAGKVFTRTETQC
jgi:hypothetical protein